MRSALGKCEFAAISPHLPQGSSEVSRVAAMVSLRAGRYTGTMWEIRKERPGDEAEVESLVELGFGPGRYAKTAYRLREGVRPDTRLSFVAEAKAGGTLLGSVRFWPVLVGTAPSLLLGPLAVIPKLRGQGIGIGLMQRGIEEALALDSEYESVILVGDEPYYARVSFARLPAGRVRLPGPADPSRILGLALRPNALVTLAGEVKRARIDIPVSAAAAPLG